MTLKDDLLQGQALARRERPCTACVAIEKATGDVKALLTSAFAGSIGVVTLVGILAENKIEVDGQPIGRRTIERHRNEAHFS